MNRKSFNTIITYKVKKTFKGNLSECWSEIRSANEHRNDFECMVHEWIMEDKKSGLISDYTEIKLEEVPYKDLEHYDPTVEKRYFINRKKKYVIEYVIKVITINT